MAAHQGPKAKSLISQPYQNWKDARSDLSHQAVLQYHRDLAEVLNSFVSCFQNPNRCVDHSLTNASTELVEKNRAYISSIICANEYCGRQGISLRGHRDDEHLFNDEEPNVNREDFRELILLICELDKNFKGSILSSKRNANYLSKTTQNDLLFNIKL